MNKKSIYGLFFIAAAAVIAIAAVTLYGRTIQLNYIEQIHLQDGYLYYVDRGEDESLKIIRSDTDGKNGDLIICKKHDREKYRIIRQIFFDDESRAYVLMEEMNVESWNGVSCRVYQCDFDRGRLVETEYDLTGDAAEYSQLFIQHIRDGRLYYVGIPDSETGTEPAVLFSLDAPGHKNVLEEVSLKYPYMNSQFFLSRDGVLMWMDYAGQIRVKELGAEKRTKIKGITARPGVFKSLSDDGTDAYVLDYQEKCIRSVDLSERTSEIVFSEEEIRKKYPGFTFQNLQSIDCTSEGFCAGVEDGAGLVSVCSYQNGNHQDISEIILTVPAAMHRLAWVYAGILLAALVLCVYWIARVKYHFQTILVRLCVVFLLGLLAMDGFLEYWVGQSMRRQLGGNQTISLSALGKVLKEDIIHNIETDAEIFPSGDRALTLSHRSLNGEKGSGELCMYVYSILEADEDGKLYVSESMSEYCGVPLEWVYAREVTEEIYQAFDSGEIVNKVDEGRSGKRNNQFIPLVLPDGTKYGVLVVSVNGNIQDYQVWYYQWNLKNVSSMLLFVLTVILMVILSVFLRPLKSLKECAGKLAAGNFGITVPVHGQDEVANISMAFNRMSLELDKYVRDIRGISDGYYKFVPAKILDLLGKESIQEVKLGDQVTGEYTILSLHAIDYPKQSVSFSAEQVYGDINKVLSVLVEPVNSHSGMVEHFEDTGLSALFTAESREALDAAIEMQNLLRERMPGKGRTIAISYGRVVIGVIGHKKRMEAATISAHSDLAKALRLKGDKYGAHILITHLVYKQIPDFEEHYHARYLGNIYLSANNTYERVYDVYDGDSEEEFYYKEQTKELFEQGVGLFVAKKFYEARLVFVEVLKQHRKDEAAKEYLYRCDKYYKLAASEVETVIEKFLADCIQERGEEMDERDLEDQRNENENEERQENREDVEMAAAEQLLAGANPAPAMQPMQQDDRENPGGDDSDDPAPGAVRGAPADPAPQQQNPGGNPEQNGGAGAGAALVQGGNERQNEGAGEGGQQGQDDNLDVDQDNNARQGQGANPNNARPGAERAGDEINLNIGQVAMDAMGDQPIQQGGQGEDANRAFDTLQDLSNLAEKKADWNAASQQQGVSQKLKESRNGLIRVRTGNLYRAVIYARMLENGERPAAAAKKAGGAEQAQKPSRFSRFMKASEFDKADKVMTRVNAVSGLAATADAGYAKSGIKTAIGLAADFVKLVSSIRGIFNKIKNFKKNPTKRSKVFTIVGVIGDFLTAISKAASIAKTMIGWTGIGNQAKAGDVAIFAGLGGQVAGVAGLINGIQQIDTGIRMLKKDQEADREAVLNIIRGNGNPAAGEGDAAPDHDEEPNAGNEPDEAAGAHEPSAQDITEGHAGRGGRLKRAIARNKQKRAQARQRKQENAAEKKANKLDTDRVLDAFNHQEGLTEEQKAVMASYLGRERMIAKKKLALSNASIGLITSAFGIGASISGGVASVRGQKKAAAYKAQVEEAKSNGEEAPEPDKSTDPAMTASTALGGMANANMLLTATGMHFANKKVNGEPEKDMAGAVREGLWGALHSLGSDDKNGLRGIAATLEPGTATDADAEKAADVVKKYDTAAKQFAGSGVMYSKLFEANDIDIFKDALIAGL